MSELLEQSGTGVRLRTAQGEIDVSWRWLRDHARDESSFLASAQQRIVTPATVAAAGTGSASVDHELQILDVVWSDGTATRWDLAWLIAVARGAAEATSVDHLLGEPIAWTGADLADRLTRLDAAQIDTDDGLSAALRGLARDGVIMLSGLDIDTAATRRVIERFGYVRMTIFGDLWEFRSDGGFDDTASTPLEITPHTDGTYSHDAPGLLALHCHAYDAEGGENVFVCGHAISERLAFESPAHHELLRTVDIPGQYIGDGAHLMAKRPALRFDGDRLAQISYNHHDRAPFRLPEPTMTELLDALAHLDAIASDPAMQIEVELRPGDMVVFDNWRVLHGRRAFRGDRLIAGGYVNREDVESTARRLLTRP